ncbi:mediator of RNA polymerase II transcription subunit 15-like [Hetaerina americana]|uniref:mediator of RNA polymerase II transcription subunit 15-like n=1 Tax=Hetaerina americana TaxID=62018 RepID=UPI003A7F32FF
MSMRLFWAAALCICGVSAGLLPASTQVFIPAASPTPFIYLDQPQQHETLTAHQPLTYQLSLAYPGAPTASAPIATPTTLTGISGTNVVTESVSSRAGDRISSSGLERTSGIDRQRERQQQQQIQQRQQQQQIQQRQQQLREQQQIQQQQIQQQQIQQQQIQQQQIQEQQQRQQQQQQQQTQQRHRFEYSVNEFGRREGVDALRQAQNQQQQIAQQQQFQQQQQQQQFAQQQLQDQQRYDYNVNEASFGGISREGRPETADVNLDASRHAEPIQSRNRASFLAEQHGVPQTQAVEGNVHRRPDISSLTLSLQRQGHGSFSTGSTRSQLPGSLSIQRQQSQTEQRIAFQGLGVDPETARFQQRQREQQAAAAARVAGPAPASFEEATVRAYPTVLPTLAPTVAAVTAHGLPQPHPTDSGFSSYSVRFVSPQFGYGYYGDQHSLQQQSSILVRSSLEGAGLASNAVGASGDIVGNH